MQRILIIENQFTQFTQISKLLMHFYEVSPTSPVEFKEVLDLVRIILHPGFGELDTGAVMDGSFDIHMKRSLCLSNLLLYIKAKKLSYIILDHKLLGGSYTYDGIDLAKYLRTCKIDIPILFLSSSSIEEPRILGVKRAVSYCDWMFKGDSNIEIDIDRQINTDLITRLEKLGNSNKHNIFVENSRTLFEIASKVEKGNDWQLAKYLIDQNLKSEKIDENIFLYVSNFVNSVNVNSANIEVRSEIAKLINNLKHQA